VAKKGAKRTIFEGNMLPQKMHPQKWRQYWRHNRNPVELNFSTHQKLCTYSHDNCEYSNCLGQLLRGKGLLAVTVLPIQSNLCIFFQERRHVPLKELLLRLNRTLWGQFLREI
jgi:hypothetical protein